jgi:hypothetical protein
LLETRSFTEELILVIIVAFLTLVVLATLNYVTGGLPVLLVQILVGGVGW